MERWEYGVAPDSDAVIAHAVGAVRETLPYVRSMVLGGSRARPDDELAPSQDSDFDFALVVPTWRAFANYPAMNALAHRLSTRTGCEISLNPIPERALQRAGNGNLMLQKFATAGVIAWGPDLLETVRPAPSTTPLNYRHLYMVFLIRQLLETLPWDATAAESDALALQRRTRKALVGLAELRLLDVDLIPKTGGEALDMLHNVRGEDRLCSALACALGRTGDSNADEVWWEARELVLLYASDLARSVRNAAGPVSPANGPDIVAALDAGLDEGPWLRELQFVVGTAMSERRAPVRTLFRRSRRSDLAVRHAMFLLLHAISRASQPVAEDVRLAWELASERVGLRGTMPDDCDAALQSLRPALLRAHGNACRAFGS